MKTTKLQTRKSTANSITAILVKPTFFLLFLCLKGKPVFSQVWEWGGSATSDELGTSSNDDLIIVTNDVPQISIDVLGNVTMGLTNPPVTLDLNGEYMIGGVRALYLEPSVSNLFAGEGAGASITTGTGNTFIGYLTGNDHTSGQDNTFVGAGAGQHNTEDDMNTFIGFGNGQYSSGERNTFIGRTTGFENEGEDNIFLGVDAGKQNTGSCNTIIGNYNATLTTGSNNAFVGYKTAYGNTSGHSNSFFGTESGFSNSTGIENTFVGFQTGNSNVSGGKNTFVGFKAGQVNTGSNNTYLGYNANGSASLSKAAAIGYNASVTGDNKMVLGGTGSDAVYVGVGTSNPAIIMDIYPTVTYMGYGIGGYTVLQNWGDRNIFVGVGAGTSNTTGTDNTFTGFNAGGSNTTGIENTFLGQKAGFENETGIQNAYVGYETGGLATGSENTFLGYHAGWQSLSDSNVLVGWSAGVNCNGARNVFIGVCSGRGNTGRNNAVIGYKSGDENQGSCNSFLGVEAGFGNKGNHNVCIGYWSGQLNVGNDNVFAGAWSGAQNEGSNNAFNGHNSGVYNESGSYNSFFGSLSGKNNVDGNHNTFLGCKAGEFNTGSKNTFVGYNAGGTAGISNASAIGYNANVTAPNSMVLGGTGTDAVNVGIGTTAPDSKFEVQNNNEQTGTFISTTRTPADPDDINFGLFANTQGSERANTSVIGYVNFNDQNSPSNLINTGVHGWAEGSTFQNIGGSFIVPTDAPVNIGVFSMGRTSALFLGSGTVFGNWSDLSDVTLKDSLEDLNNALELISQLQPKRYVFKDSLDYLNLPDEAQIGLIAQQVDSIEGLSELVNEVIVPEVRDTSGSVIVPMDTFLSLNYTAILPVVVCAVQELNSQVVKTCEPVTLTNTVPKWNDTIKTLCNSQIIDNGTTVGIGIDPDTIDPEYTPTLLVTGDTIGILSYSQGSGNHAFGVYSMASGGFDRNFGVMGLSTNPGADTAICIGTGGVGGNSSFGNAGVAGWAEFPNATAINVGTYGRGISGFLNAGGYFDAADTSGNLSYGLYARSGSAQNALAGFFQGSVAATGGVLLPADAALADSIGDLDNSLETLALLQPKRMTFKTSEFPFMNLPAGEQVNLLADTIIPSLTRTVTNPIIVVDTDQVLMDTLSYHALDYARLTTHIVAGINELNQNTVKSCEPASLTNRVTKWSDDNKSLCATNIIAQGGRVGIDSIHTGATFTVFTETDTFGIQAEGVQTGARFKGQNAGVAGFADGGNDNDFQAGVIGYSENAAQLNIGVMGSAESAADTVPNIGTMGRSGNSQVINAGVAGIAEPEDNQTPSDSALYIGIAGICSGSEFQNHGGYFYVADDTIGTNYAITAKTNTSDTSDYAGYFDGKVVYTGALYSTSDARLKENITAIDDAMNLINQMEPKKYEYKRDDYKAMSLPAGTQYGLLADDLEKIVPELVTTVTHPEYRDLKGNRISASMEYKAINYIELIPILIDAIKQQQETIDNLSQRLTDVEGTGGPQFRISDPGSEETVHEMTVELSSLQVVVLEQNVPNPFAEQTTISYFIPEEQAGAAQILFFDHTGKAIKTVDVQKGRGILTVFAPNLSSGTYSYTLLIDGKAVETKRMVKAK